jgi:hypothetical protein
LTITALKFIRLLASIPYWNQFVSVPKLSHEAAPTVLLIPKLHILLFKLDTMQANKFLILHTEKLKKNYKLNSYIFKLNRLLRTAINQPKNTIFEAFIILLI